ncbi:outer membrane beta-barrel protein [Endozoicomonas sp. SM1973]|uniref:Outer membrane beta-barrel protein n=1 Tax=Spartinivicinus marinus TaxID=2994442 RepID=A0A853I7R5_9GAMM|nr:OmpW family outer membrane protein [Spartinivicinus marinus]MCX4025871.1 outer membrane beta-barrel protein [Spartinivicinus marinus]NYZ68859.1 outer membrane beta-barrel protein [Spartinivicinus marinus]
MRTPIAVFATAALSLALSQAAMAYQEGDFIVRAGAATVDPNEDSSNVKAGGADTGWTAGVDSNTQLGLTGTYMITDHIGIGLLAATPFEHTLDLKNSPDNGSLADIKHLPPTLTVQYYFNDTKANLQPYVGAGVNYTTFFDEKFTSKHKSQGYNSLELEDSWGIAFEAGIDYQLTDNLLVNASVWYIDIDTEANFKVGNTKAKVDVELDPWVYMVGLGYKF